MSDSSVVAQNTPLEGLDQLFLRVNRNALPVVDDEEQLVGIVSLTDYRRAVDLSDDSDAAPKTSVRDIMTSDPVTVFPDDSLNTVLQRMAPRDLSRLPVVDRTDHRKVLGVIRRSDVVRAYDLGLARRGKETPEVLAGIRRTSSVDFIEVDLTNASRCVGRSISDISSELPEECLVISIRRLDGSTVFPRGGTIFKDGDRVVAYADKSRLQELRRCFES
jgi:CIC family chloride channel protein